MVDYILMLLALWMTVLTLGAITLFVAVAMDLWRDILKKIRRW